MVADKVQTTYNTWLNKLDSKVPQPEDISRLYELAYQIYLAKQTDSKHWAQISGGQWLADRLSKDGRFSNQQINRLSYMVDDLVSYNHWLFKRNNEI